MFYQILTNWYFLKTGDGAENLSIAPLEAQRMLRRLNGHEPQSVNFPFHLCFLIPLHVHMITCTLHNTIKQSQELGPSGLAGEHLQCGKETKGSAK